MDFFEKDIEVLNEVNFDVKNKNYNLNKFYSEIKNTINNFNEIIETNSNKKFYLWPASIHSLYLLVFGLDEGKLNGFADNSINKIGKKMYGTDLKVFDFKKILEDRNSIVLFNGGIFNSEVTDKVTN